MSLFNIQNAVSDTRVTVGEALTLAQVFGECYADSEDEINLMEIQVNPQKFYNLYYLLYKKIVELDENVNKLEQLVYAEKAEENAEAVSSSN